jgi:hypothetical protein
MSMSKTLLHISTAFLLFGAIVFLGILSYTGMLYYSGLVALSIASCFLAVLIEGEIFRKNILSGMKKLLHFGDYVRRDSYCKVLKTLANEENLRNDCSFLQDYFKEKNSLKKQKKHPKKLDAAAQRELDRSEARVEEMENFFIQYIDGENDESIPAVKKLNSKLDDLFQKLEAKKQLCEQLKGNKNPNLFPSKNQTFASLQKNIFWEQCWLYASMLITIIGGLMAMLVAASQLTASLAPLAGTILPFGLVITPLLISTVIWPVVILAGLSTMMMTYNTFVGIIHHRKWLNHWDTFSTKFKNATTPTKVLYAFASLLLITVAVLATVAMIGTWSTIAKEGLILLPVLATATLRLKSLIVTIGITMHGISHFLFDFATSLESFAMVTSEPSLTGIPENLHGEFKNASFIGQLWMKLKLNVQKSYTDWSKLRGWEQFNPFTALTLTIDLFFRTALYIGHLISIGVTADRVENWPAIIPTVITGGQEGITDIPYVFHGEDGHHHSDLAGNFLYYTLMPIKFIAIGWNGVFSYLFAGEKGFTNYYEEAFGRPKKHKTKLEKTSAPLSAEQQHYELERIISNAVEQFSDNDQTEEAEVFQAAQKIIRNGKISIAPSKTLSITNSIGPQLFNKNARQTLSQLNSWSFWSTEAQDIIKTIDETFTHSQLVMTQR